MPISFHVKISLIVACYITTAVVGAVGQDDDVSGYPLTIPVAEKSDEAEQALGTFKIPAGWKSELWAAEPMVGNPVVFTIDNHGRVFVCESYRQNTCITDNREHDDVWLDRDLAAQTVEDRIAYHKELLPGKGVEFTKHDDLLRVLVDSDGDGKANQQTIWADHFNEIEMGTGAGVLVHGDDVFYTCIPHLWRLRDNDGDGKADFRESLSRGYGVRVAFRGHDCHGLVMGPDGRVYFSIGDRGYHIVTQEGKKLHDPASGAVFRCELDGSNLEVVATGLRNPQELAFDDFGNLFTGDNNSDGGDKARWVYVAAGGDSGWRMHYQYLDDRGPFSREKLWHPYHREQPAFIVPPVANFSDGPSGLAHYPGTGLSDEFNDCFFLCDFRGASAVSGIRTLRSKPQGAFYELVDDRQPIWQILATDLHFGPDGWIYVSDWVNGWVGENKGRIYRFADPVHVESAAVKEVQALLNSELADAASDRLVELMNHADQRVRQMAQFAMVERNLDKELIGLATSQTSLLGRLHAIWGIGQRIRSGGNDELSKVIAELLSDQEAEVRAQAVQLAGDLRLQSTSAALMKALSDAEPRVRYYAGISLGKLDFSAAVTPLLTLLRENDGADPAIRHAAIMGLAGQRNPEIDYVTASRESDSVEVQRALVVVLRKQNSSGLPEFFEFATDQLVLDEVARAIYDIPNPTQFAELAARLDSSIDSEPFLLRCIGACNHLGGEEHAERLARFAAADQAPETMRIEAIKTLSAWASPAPRDRIIGMWRPIKERGAEQAALALAPVFEKLLDSSELQAAAIDAASALRISAVSGTLENLLIDETSSDENRKAALLALSEFDAPNLAKLTVDALVHPSSLLRMAAREVNVVKSLPATLTLEFWLGGLKSKDLRERQHTYGLLSSPQSRLNTTAESIVARQTQRLLIDAVPKTDRLDIVNVLEEWSHVDSVVAMLETYRKSFDQVDLVSKYQDSLFGGDAERGEDIFLNRTAVSCQRCHQIGAAGGAVGPNLSDIGLKKNRKYLLEALVAPDKSIAENFETTVIVDVDGNTLSGIVQKETDETIQIIDVEAKVTVVNKDDIEGRRKGKSAMPSDSVKHLSPSEIRDLIEFLATQKAPPAESATESTEGH